MGRRSARLEERAFVIEGQKLLDEAVASGTPVEEVYVAPGYDHGHDLPTVELAPGVVERVADTVTPQPVLAVAPFVDRPLDEARNGTFLVVCVDVRDPGNAGTVLRSAEAAGADAVICTDGSVDLYNPKTVRASAGSLFHVRVVVGGGAVEVLDTIKGWGVTRLGTTAHGGVDYTACDLTGPVAIVLGNEGNGLPADAAACIDQAVTIPMVGRSESLNVGMAAAVLCFETARQRREQRREASGR